MMGAHEHACPAAPHCTVTSATAAGIAAHARHCKVLKAATQLAYDGPTKSLRNSLEMTKPRRSRGQRKTASPDLHVAGVDIVLQQLLPKGVPPEKMGLLVRWIELTLELMEKP